ncbi:hypothetical protein EG831_03570 [bacterium]|nr:hypothetical protein [bacterium]
MSKQHVLSQVYGYAACLVTLLTFVFSIPSFVESLFDLSDITHSSDYSSKYVSFENYRSSYIATQKEVCSCEQEGKDKVKVTLPEDQTLQRMYETEKADEIARTLFQTRRRFFMRLIMIAVSTILFVFHWRWVRKFSSVE